MISGKIAGVSVISNDGAPGSGAQIRIRGGSSLNASNDPLIVIDGLAMDNYGVQGLSNPLSMVNPNDIESFTVLKDASATAIYGSRASNGVIIITTKKGRSGQAPKVSYSGNMSISTKKKTFDVMSGPEYREFIKNLYGEKSAAYKALGYYTYDKETISPIIKDDKITGYKSEFNQVGEQQFADTNWQDEIYRTAISHDHNITIQGGLKNMPYRASLGYTNNEGIIKTSKFERYTASMSLNPSFLQDHLKFNINGKGMIAKSRYADGGAIGAARYMDPTKPVSVNNGVYEKYFGGYTQWYTSSSTYMDPNWGTIVRDDTNTGNFAGNHVLCISLETMVHVIRFDSSNRSGQVVLLSYTITDDYDLVQRFRIIFQGDVHVVSCFHCLRSHSQISESKVCTWRCIN
jgi:TonB-dependent starch-binding outer membrane protein SusC